MHQPVYFYPSNKYAALECRLTQDEYRPGDILATHLTLHVLIATPVKQLTATLVIAENVQFHLTDSAPDQFHHCYVFDTVHLISTAESSRVYEPGAYSFHAKWVLPSLIESFRYRHRMTTAQMQTYVSCYLDLPRRAYRARAGAEFNVVHPPKPLLLPTPFHAVGDCDIMWLRLKKIGSCSITLALSADVWEDTQPIQASLLIHCRRTDLQIKAVVVEVVEDTVFHLKAPKRRSYAVAGWELAPASLTQQTQQIGGGTMSQASTTLEKRFFEHADRQLHLLTITHRIVVRLSFHGKCHAQRSFPFQVKRGRHS